jgi:hypothetical protein
MLNYNSNPLDVSGLSGMKRFLLLIYVLDNNKGNMSMNDIGIA